MKLLLSFKEPFLQFIHQLQDEICQALLAEDHMATITEDNWTREEGGGGKTRVIAHGNVFEKGGVNTSAVHGKLPPAMMSYLETGYSDFFACGISLVIHPINPFIPTVHANYRYFELYDHNQQIADHWFGGGSDLTPCYLFEEDIQHFHHTLYEVCNRFDHSLYPKFSKSCNDYFYNHCRQEARGIGGIFFDRLRNDGSHNPEYWFDFVSACGNSFIESYLPIVQKRKEMAWTEAHKFWQEIRRGRYVEFNLLHDKGTMFGLKTNGRMESILMSLPPTVRWEYNYQPDPGSEEARLLEVLKHPKSDFFLI
jgi:coproporphyrinogen III oxidase